MPRITHATQIDLGLRVGVRPGNCARKRFQLLSSQSEIERVRALRQDWRPLRRVVRPSWSLAARGISEVTWFTRLLMPASARRGGSTTLNCGDGRGFSVLEAIET
jgi:hypothetical protein